MTKVRRTGCFLGLKPEANVKVMAHRVNRTNPIIRASAFYEPGDDYTSEGWKIVRKEQFTAGRHETEQCMIQNPKDGAGEVSSRRKRRKGSMMMR